MTQGDRELIERLRDATPPHFGKCQAAADRLQALSAESEKYRTALRECRKAVSGQADEPRRNVREIVDQALKGANNG
jgi:hypothetical protein